MMTVKSEYTREQWITKEGDFKGIVKETMTSRVIKNVQHKLDPTREYPNMAKDQTKSETLELKEFHPTGAVSKIVGTPIDLRRIIKMNKPAVRIKYELVEISKTTLEHVVKKIKV